MERLTHQDLEAVLDTTRLVYAHTDLTTLPQLLIALQSRLVPCDISTYNEIDIPKGEFRAVHDHGGSDAEKLFPQFIAHVGEHPVTPKNCHLSNGQVGKTSDFISQRQFEGMAVFNEFYRHFGIRYQMAFYPDCGTPFWVGFALQRLHRDFTERDRQVLSLISPHFAQALRNAQAFSTLQERIDGTNHSLSDNAQGIISLDREGQILWMTGRCSRWLKDYFPNARKAAGILPEQIRKWLKQTKQQGTDPNQLRARRRPLIVEGPGRRLRINASQDEAGRGMLLLSEEEYSQSPRLDGFKLTAREQEVVRWIAQGKSNPEIAAILSLSPRTVHKHVEHILEKTGVETRAGIMLKVMDRE